MMFFKCNNVFTLVFLLLLYFNNIVYTHVDDIKDTSQKKITYDKYNTNKENMNNEKNDNKDSIYNNNNDNINKEDEYKFLSIKNYRDNLSNKLNNENDHMNYLIRKRKDNAQGSQQFNENNENNENSSIMNSESYNNIINSNEHNEEQIKKKEEDLIEAFFPFILKKLNNESLSVDHKYDDYDNLPSDHNDTHKENSSDHNLLEYKLGNNLKSYLVEENDVPQTTTDDINESASSDSEDIQEILSTDSNTSHLKEQKNQTNPPSQHKSQGTKGVSNSQVISPEGKGEQKSQPQHPLVKSGDQKLEHPKEIDDNAEKIRRTLLKESRDIKNTTAIIDETVYKFEQLIMKGRYYATAVKNFVIFKVNYICEYSKCGPNSRCYIVEKDKEQCRCRPNYIVDMSVNYFKCIPMKDMNCSKNNGGCDVNAECTIVEGAVKCQCSHLYFGDGVFCVKNSQTKQTLYILLIVILLVFQNFFI
ncbi:merozoite surface protein 10 [Plasmodium reichenowi]|uniref:Merozoite surface protein 10 n=1 Tax=Plasmodium reichenowi TaxID=5854 RepID=A0A151LPP9_PLARE|nr:merozoite surface protein 10 [Plasmodium reichenowi]KYO01087.1 merozoite surface protein 10 [Plasmodium reichenowi]